MNTFVRKLSIALLILGVVAGIIGFLAPKYHVVPIVMFHRVETTEEYKPNSVDPEIFEFQMNYLARHRYNVIPLDELMEAIDKGKTLKKKSLVITFDDGTEDNYSVAYPVLKKYNFPATIFMVSTFIDQEGFLTSDQIREMNDSVVNFQSHTRTHAYLPEISAEQQKQEIAGSKKDLEKLLGNPVEYFSYPVGGYNEAIIQLVKDAGYKGAVTTNRGLTRWNKNMYELKRVRFGERDTNGFTLWAKLSGYYNLFRKTKNPY